MRKKIFVLSGILFLAQVIIAQNLVPFNCGSNKWGYKNINSNMIVVDCQFTFAGQMEGGYADIAVDGKWGVIDSTGKIVIQPKYSSIWSVHKGTVIYEEVSSGRRGITSVSGKVTLPPGKLKYIGSFNNGYSIVAQETKKGMIDYLGNLVVPMKYDNLYPFNEGLAAAELDDKWGFIDVKGKVAVPLKYESVSSFSEGFAAVTADGKRGYVDRKGKLMSPVVWEYAGSFSGGMAPVKKDGLYGFINKNGELAVPCRYEGLDKYASGFTDGRAVVMVNGKFGCIDNTGKEIVAPVYDSFLPFSDGLALVSKDGKKTYIDVDGNVKINADYDEVNSFSRGLAMVKKNGKYGLIRTDGSEAFPCQFTELRDKEGFWYAEMYAESVSIKGYIDANGRPYYYSDEDIKRIEEERNELIRKMNFDINDMAKYVCYGYKNFFLGYGERKNSFSIGSKSNDYYEPSIQPSDTFRIRNLGQDRVYVEISLTGYSTSDRRISTVVTLKCPMSLKYGLVTDAGLVSSNPGLRAILLIPVLSEGAPSSLETIKGCYLPWEDRIYFTGYLQFDDGLKYFELTAKTDPSKPYQTVEKSLLQMILDLYKQN